MHARANRSQVLYVRCWQPTTFLTDSPESTRVQTGWVKSCMSGVERNVREAKLTLVGHFAREKARSDLVQDAAWCRVCFLTGSWPLGGQVMDDRIARWKKPGFILSDPRGVAHVKIKSGGQWKQPLASWPLGGQVMDDRIARWKNLGVMDDRIDDSQVKKPGFIHCQTLGE